MKAPRRLLAALLLAATTSIAQKHPLPSVPFVGCPADGQTGTSDAPQGHSKELRIAPEVAAHLAWYQAPDDVDKLGALAPRGWHCFATYGSNGTTLLIAPEPMDADKILLHKNWNGFTGPAIELSVRYSGTSGRVEVAHVIARVFPAHHDFAKKVMAEQLDPPSNYQFSPFPTDKLHYHGPDFVEYTTPAHADGIGTISSLKAGDQPILGFALLHDGMSLTQFNIRLPSDLESLAPTLVKLEKQSLRKSKAH